MQPIIAIENLSKIYASGFQALKGINLAIRRGEIFALLGPNGAGKTTLINIICGIVTPSAGTVTVDGHDIITDYRAARSLIGLVPQELHDRHVRDGLGDGDLQPRAVRQAARSRIRREGAPAPLPVGPQGQQDHDAVRRHETPGDDRQGAMHEPQVLFLDEPTAGVDVELRKDMWQVVRSLRESA